MTIELVLFIALSNLLFNIIGFWAIVKVRDAQLEINCRMWDRLNYLEAGMSYHGMIPMPWEIEEVVEEIKSFKQEGNVVYLQKE